MTHGSITRGRLIEADTRETLEEAKAALRRDGTMVHELRRELSLSPNRAALETYRSAPVVVAVPLLAIEISDQRCPACGRRRRVEFGWMTMLGFSHRATRCSWWRRLFGCRERRPHFHLACECGERWIVGHAAEPS